MNPFVVYKIIYCEQDEATNGAELIIFFTIKYDALHLLKTLKIYKYLILYEIRI